jgi:hypothetical protein
MRGAHHQDQKCFLLSSCGCRLPSYTCVHVAETYPALCVHPPSGDLCIPCLMLVLGANLSKGERILPYWAPRRCNQ